MTDPTCTSCLAKRKNAAAPCLTIPCNEAPPRPNQAFNQGRICGCKRSLCKANKTGRTIRWSSCCGPTILDHITWKDWSDTKTSVGGPKLQKIPNCWTVEIRFSQNRWHIPWSLHLAFIKHHQTRVLSLALHNPDEVQPATSKELATRRRIVFAKYTIKMIQHFPL